jgi:hypothetical protein
MANSGSFNTSASFGRYLNFSWSVQSQSTQNNSTTITWTLTGGGDSGYVVCGPIKVLIAGQQVYYSSARIEVWLNQTVASGTFTIGHNNDGNKSFDAYVEAAIYYSSINCSGSGSWALPKIARFAVMTSATDFTDIQNPSFTFSNPANSAMSCWLEPYPNGDHLAERTFSGTSGTFTWDLTEAERNQLRERCTNAKSCTCRIGLYSTIGSDKLPSFLDKTLTIVNANPTIEAVTYKDNNSTTANLTENNQLIVRNKSILYLTATNLKSYKYATLSSLQVTINGITKSFSNISGTSIAISNLSFGTLNVSSDINATITLKDSRGYTATKAVAIKILDYSEPNSLINLQRKSNFYTETDLLVNCTFSSLNNKNNITIQYQTKKIDDADYGNLITIQNNTPYVINLDNNYKWEVKIVTTDSLNTTVVYIRYLDRGIPLIFFDRRKSSTGINCFPKDNNSFEVSGINILKAILGEELYNDSNGSDGIISLSDDVTNYTYIDIFYTDNNNNGHSFIRVYNPNNKSLDLSIVEASDSTAGRTYIRRTTYEISNQTLTPNTLSAGYVLVDSTSVSTTSGTNFIKINRVVGYNHSAT